MRTFSMMLALLAVLLVIGCVPQAACEGQQVRIGSVCCDDANQNTVCDTSETSAASGTPSSPPLTPAGQTTTTKSGLQPRTLDDIQTALERYLNYYVIWKGDWLPDNHYAPVNDSYFNVYGSPGIDLLVVKDQKDYFSDFAGFQALMQRYADERASYDHDWLTKKLPRNETFTQWTNLTVLDEPGGKLLEYRDRAEIDVHGTNDMGSPYTDAVEPFGVVTIYLPCKPNVVVAFSSVKQPSLFVANYEGEQYRSELEKSLNDLSNEQMFKAVKIFSACRMD